MEKVRKKPVWFQGSEVEYERMAFAAEEAARKYTPFFADPIKPSAKKAK